MGHNSTGAWDARQHAHRFASQYRTLQHSITLAAAAKHKHLAATHARLALLRDERHAARSHPPDPPPSPPSSQSSEPRPIAMDLDLESSESSTTSRLVGCMPNSPRPAPSLRGPLSPPADSSPSSGTCHTPHGANCSTPSTSTARPPPSQRPDAVATAETTPPQDHAAESPHHIPIQGERPLLLRVRRQKSRPNAT